MAIFEWRKFNFFDLKKDVDNGQVATAIKDSDITCATDGNNQIILCDSIGNVHVFVRSWQSTTFKAHDGPVLLCKYCRQNSLLITVGNEDNGTVPAFKIWHMTKLIKGVPTLLRVVKTVVQKPTALGVSEGGQYMAIGFDKGSISLYKGDIGRDRSKTMKTLSGGTTSITGIAFKTMGKIVQMFVCSDSGVLLYNLHSRDKETKIVLDTTCAPIRCCALQTGQGPGETHFMVGRDDAVYCYTSDDRGPCYALDGQKSILQWFRSHLLTVSKPTKNTISSQKDSILTVIDIQNKFIVFSSPIDSVAAILIDFGTCFIVTHNKEIYHLDEKDLQSKLSMLFKKNLYDIAVRIAKSSQYDSEGLAEIFRQYGDHLYGKGDFSGSVEQYAKTIGYLEPSYVIRKFLDSRHIHCLTDYLQELHKLGKATADHTTLLLNCFTRLDRTDQLKEFLKNDRNPDLIFDLDVAIKVCRNASVEHALSLAKRNQKHDFCISILTEDMKAYPEALQYISELEFSDAEQNLKKYGHLLMEHCPNETTKFLKKLCTDYVVSGAINNQEDLMDINSHIDRANPEDFLHFFVEAPDKLIEFLEHLVENVSKCRQLVFNTLIEHYLYRWKEDNRAEVKLMELLEKYDTEYDRNHALIMCRTYEFWPGIMFLYEEEKLYHLIVRYHLKNRDYNNLLETCKRLGSTQPCLWLQALTGLRGDKNAPSNLLPQILQVIALEKLQSPLQVLNCLAVESGPNISSVREYFLQFFQKENEYCKQDGEMVEKYRKDSVILKKHIKDLQETPIEFRGTVCSNCNQLLSMPSVHFLCQHSYHLDCVKGYSETDKDCPVCHTKNMQIMDALKAQGESRGQHELFHNLLDRSAEPFSVVAEYFGRGLFNKIVIVEEDNGKIEINKNFIDSNTNPSNIIPKPTYGAGAGAEAKIRITEGLHGTGIVETNRIPIAEGRMRLQERHRDTNLSTSLDANITTIKRDRSPRTPANSPRTNTISNNQMFSKTTNQSDGGIRRNNSSNIISKNLANVSSNPKNPFEEDEIEYDASKNPFADDEETVEKDPTNPFDYDSNLNPFE